MFKVYKLIPGMPVELYGVFSKMDNYNRRYTDHG